jgi:uncharacterized protein YcgL (UPF0745 family)
MKDQYFGDINDYRKYGLIRAIIGTSRLRVLVAWMLTHDDGSADGKFVSYLKQPHKWYRYDPILFEGLQGLLANGHQRQVSLIENTGLLSNAEYFSVHVPDSASDRNEWFTLLSEQARKSDLVFIDPDNGLEIKSRPYGRKNSSKFSYWREVQALWISGKSLLIYQHFIRENRSTYIQRRLEDLKAATPGSFVEAFSTPHVVFLMALQPNHQLFHPGIVESVRENWEGQIHHWNLGRAQQCAPADRQTATRFVS